MNDFPLKDALNAEANRVHRAPNGQSLPYLRPRDAATLIVVDRKGPAPRVLMGKRHEGHKFMPGMFVFPGGRAERSDAAIPVASELLPEVEASLIARCQRGTSARARRLALAAIRETFEETGLVIGLPGTGATRTPGPWSEFLATGYLPDLASIRFLARAVTPPGRTKRFDTRFFVVEAEAIRHKTGDVVGPDSELTELAWLTFDETEKLPLPVITRIMLGELHQGLDAGWPDTPMRVPYYFRRKEIFQREFVA